MSQPHSGCGLRIDNRCGAVVGHNCEFLWYDHLKKSNAVTLTARGTRLDDFAPAAQPPPLCGIATILRNGPVAAANEEQPTVTANMNVWVTHPPEL